MSKTTAMTRPRKNPSMDKTTARPSHKPGAELKALLNQYGLFGSDAAAFAGKVLGYNPATIYALMSRQIRMNDYELLEYKLIEYYVETAVKESSMRKYGPVREDGKRHRRDDWLSLRDLKKEHNRDYMRRIREQNPNRWRTPEKENDDKKNPSPEG